MHKVLLLDTNISSYPIHDFLVGKDFDVFTVGKNPHDYLAKNNSNYYNADYTNHLEMKGLIEGESFEYVIPGCNDASYRSAVKLNGTKNNLGLDNLETTDVINNKKLFRDFAISNCLSVPSIYSEEFNPLSFPLIVKPADAYSGRGITMLLEPNEELFYSAINHAKSFSKENMCVIEEYVLGQLYSHTAFIVNKNIVQDFFVEEHGSADPFAVDTSRVVWDFNPSMSEQIQNHIHKLAKSLNLVDGLVHTQFILRENKFWIIEITRRCPGDLYSQLINLSTGYDYTTAYVNPFIGLSPQKMIGVKKRNILRLTITPTANGKFKGLSFSMPINIVNLFMLRIPGESIEMGTAGRVGIFFLETSTEQELDELLHLAIERRLYSTHQL